MSNLYEKKAEFARKHAITMECAPLTGKELDYFVKTEWPEDDENRSDETYWKCTLHRGKKRLVVPYVMGTSRGVIPPNLGLIMGKVHADLLYAYREDAGDDLDPARPFDRAVLARANKARTFLGDDLVMAFTTSERGVREGWSTPLKLRGKKRAANPGPTQGAGELVRGLKF